MATTDEKLHDIKNQLAVLIARSEVIDLRLKEFNLLLRGDGGDIAGMVIDMDRLKEAKKNQDRTFWVVMTTAVGLIIKYVWDFFTRSG